MPPSPCERHANEIADQNIRLTRLESIVGESSTDGLRAEMGQLRQAIAELTTTIQAQRIEDAKRSGQVQGATWAAKLIWAVFGAGTLAFVTNLFDTFRNSPTPHQ